MLKEKNNHCRQNDDVYKTFFLIQVLVLALLDVNKLWHIKSSQSKSMNLILGIKCQKLLLNYQNIHTMLFRIISLKSNTYQVIQWIYIHAFRKIYQNFKFDIQSSLFQFQWKNRCIWLSSLIFQILSKMIIWNGKDLIESDIEPWETNLLLSDPIEIKRKWFKWFRLCLYILKRYKTYVRLHHYHHFCFHSFMSFNFCLR